jgi:hypothetical protein
MDFDSLKDKVNYHEQLHVPAIRTHVNSSNQGIRHLYTCAAYRNRPVFSNDSVILPASLPPAEPEPECSGGLLHLSDKDMDRIEYFQLS